jgi:hypothetical protein
MALKYTTIFHSKALQNLSKEGFFIKIYHMATLFQTVKAGLEILSEALGFGDAVHLRAMLLQLWPNAL